MSKADSDK